MARIEDLTLHPIVIDVANADVRVTFEVHYSQFDQDSNQPYRLECVLKGRDPGGEFGEDAVDDVIPNGVLRALDDEPIRSDGLAEQAFDLQATLAMEDLNEDWLGGANPDDIKAKATLKPILAHEVSVESNVRTLTIV